MNGLWESKLCTDIPSNFAGANTRLLWNLAWSETTWAGSGYCMCATTHMHLRPRRDSLIGDDIPLPSLVRLVPKCFVFVGPCSIHSLGNSSCTSFLQGVRPLHHHQSVHPSLLAEAPRRTRTAGNVLKLAQKHPGTSSHPLLWAPTSPAISQWFSLSAVPERAWTAYCAGGSLKPTWVWVFALVRI